MEACVEPVLNYDRGNIGPRSSGQYPGQMSKYILTSHQKPLLDLTLADIQSDKPNFGQPGSAMYNHVPWYYKPMRASWLPAAFQTRRLIESWREAKTVSSNRRSGRPNFDEFMNTSNNTAMAKVSNCAATIDQKQRTSSSDARSQQAGSYPENQCVSIQQSSDEVCDRQAAVYQPQSAKKRSTNVRGAQFSPSLIDGNIKNNDHINAGINKAKAAPQYPQEFLYDGSESATSESSQDDQQHLYELTQKNEKRQEAKQYMIEAIEHLVEMCNAYGDEIDEADKNEIMNEILEAIGGTRLICQ